jgi:hypothetical protein
MSLRPHSFVIASLLSLAAASAGVGCAAPDEIGPDGEVTAEGEDELIGRVAGSSLNSPNAKSSATYLTARRVDTLQQVGALTGVALGLAARVDGIIANQPADGRVSVQELLQIEKPGFIETLFAEEKAALPKVWETLETTRGVATNVTLPPNLTLEAVDLSTTGGAPIKPAKLAIASLDAGLVAAARRLQLTRNDDGDAETVTEADLDAAIATPGPYTPDEVKSFQAIKALFVARAGTALRAKVQVTDPGTTTKLLATWGPAKLSYDQLVSYQERRSRSFFGGNRSGSSLDLNITAGLNRAANVALPPDHFLVILDETSESEVVSKGGAIQKPAAGPSTVEVWSGGVRLARFRARLPAFASTQENKDLSAFGDYGFVAKNGSPLFRNVTDAKMNRNSADSVWANWSYDLAQKPVPAAAEPWVLGELVTPGFAIVPGRYEVPVPSFGNLTVDLYPEGVVRVTRPDGQSLRSRLYIWQNTQFDVTFGDRFRTIYNPQTGELNVFWDGRGTLFRAPLTGAMRKG